MIEIDLNINGIPFEGVQVGLEDRAIDFLEWHGEDLSVLLHNHHFYHSILKQIDDCVANAKSDNLRNWVEQQGANLK